MSGESYLNHVFRLKNSEMSQEISGSTGGKRYTLTSVDPKSVPKCSQITPVPVIYVHHGGSRISTHIKHISNTYQTHHTSIQKTSGWWFPPPLKSVGAIIPNIWNNKTCSKPPTSIIQVSKHIQKHIKTCELQPGPRRQ